MGIGLIVGRFLLFFSWIYPKKPAGFLGYVPGSLNPACKL